MGIRYERCDVHKKLLRVARYDIIRASKFDASSFLSYWKKMGWIIKPITCGMSDYRNNHLHCNCFCVLNVGASI